MVGAVGADVGGVGLSEGCEKEGAREGLAVGNFVGVAVVGEPVGAGGTHTHMYGYRLMHEIGGAKWIQPAEVSSLYPSSPDCEPSIDVQFRQLFVDKSPVPRIPV